MVAFENMVVNKSGTFPSTTAINATAAGATNGTEYVAAILNHIWGYHQDLLQQAGLTPSGTTEAAAASGAAAAGAGQQMRQGLEMKYGAPGEIVFDFIAPGTGTYGSQAMSWGAASGGPPSRYQNRRVIACTGQFIQASLYPDLCAAIYCGDANNATATCCYYTSDAGGTTRSTASKNYIKLPDMRGKTLRVYDHGATIDPQGGTRGSFGEIGSLQIDAMQGHYHNTYSATGAGALNVFSNTATGTALGTINAIVQAREASIGGTNSDSTAATTPRTSSESRMYNFSVNGGVRY